MRELVQTLRNYLKTELQAPTLGDILTPKKPVRFVGYHPESEITEKLHSGLMPMIIVSPNGERILDGQGKNQAGSATQLLSVRIFILQQSPESELAAFDELNGTFKLYDRVMDLIRENKRLIDDENPKGQAWGIRLPMNITDIDIGSKEVEHLAFSVVGRIIQVTYERNDFAWRSSNLSDRKVLGTNKFANGAN